MDQRKVDGCSKRCADDLEEKLEQKESLVKGPNEAQPTNEDEDEYYMKLALKVARRALEVGEVPVGCVIVMPVDDGVEENWTKDKVVDDKHRTAKLCSDHGPTRESKKELPSDPVFSDCRSTLKDKKTKVVVSHGANQVNATRDATRHAELVAIDRMLTGGLSSDTLCLPAEVLATSAARAASSSTSSSSPLIQWHHGNRQPLEQYMHDAWSDIQHEADAENTPSSSFSGRTQDSHNPSKTLQKSYGWRSGRIHSVSDLKQCTLYGKFDQYEIILYLCSISQCTVQLHVNLVSCVLQLWRKSKLERWCLGVAMTNLAVVVRFLVCINKKEKMRARIYIHIPLWAR